MLVILKLIPLLIVLMILMEKMPNVWNQISCSNKKYLLSNTLTLGVHKDYLVQYTFDHQVIWYPIDETKLPLNLTNGLSVSIIDILNTVDKDFYIKYILNMGKKRTKEELIRDMSFVVRDYQEINNQYVFWYMFRNKQFYYTKLVWLDYENNEIQSNSAQNLTFNENYEADSIIYERILTIIWNEKLIYMQKVKTWSFVYNIKLNQIDLISYDFQETNVLHKKQVCAIINETAIQMWFQRRNLPCPSEDLLILFKKINFAFKLQDTIYLIVLDAKRAFSFHNKYLSVDFFDVPFFLDIHPLPNLLNCPIWHRKTPYIALAISDLIIIIALTIFLVGPVCRLSWWHIGNLRRYCKRKIWIIFTGKQFKMEKQPSTRPITRTHTFRTLFPLSTPVIFKNRIKPMGNRIRNSTLRNDQTTLSPKKRKKTAIPKSINTLQTIN